MIAALLVAAGRGHRLGGPLPKQYRLLAGEPVLRHALRAFLRHPAIGLVRVVIHPDDTELYATATQGLILPSPIFGGPTRQDSVRLGLEALVESFPRIVLIHDAARPLVAAATIDSVIAMLDVAPGAIAALPVADTLKRCAGDKIIDTLDRSNVWRAQTPQGFRFPEILAAHRAAVGLALTDDAQVAERAGLEVRVVPGAEEAFKITTEPDLLRAEQILHMRSRLDEIP
jgi:2-C-methyl-D-erythritol 4-phosphate cytidylyltransferase/2-C-methyl-D-erythritol 2,4-cyclodiphosphate synthase